MSYDRYTSFRKGGSIEMVPFVAIPKSSEDMYETYNKGESRLDKISYDYYGSPDYAWLIMQANPEFGSMEFNIPDKSELRIPYPLTNALDAYKKEIEEYNKNYK